MALPVGVGDASDTFARFHDAYERRVRGLARHLLGGDPAVDDVVQETLWRAYRKGLHHGDGRDPWPWLATVTRNACHDVHRSRRATATLDEDLPLMEDPESEVVDAARRERVVGTLQRLPERQRRLLLLRHVEGVHCDALASSEGSSVDAVKSALARARAAFRSCYDGWRGLVPWSLGPVVARIRGAFAGSSHWTAARSGLAGGLAALFALGLLAPPGASGTGPSEGALGPEVVPVEIPSGDGVALPYRPAVESSPVPNPTGSQPEGGTRIASPPPTPRDAQPALGPASDSSGSDGVVDLPAVLDPDDVDLPTADDLVTATDGAVDTAVATVEQAEETVEPVSEPLDDGLDVGLDVVSTSLA